jgi:hypothetical protein
MPHTDQRGGRKQNFRKKNQRNNSYNGRKNNNFKTGKNQEGTRREEVEDEPQFYDDSLAESNFYNNPNQLRKFENIDIYEYQLPENFDDEEIDEETAFTNEDMEKYGDVGTKRKV